MLSDLYQGPLRWLYIDFNSYFASVEQQLNPKLRGKPVIVVPVETDSTCAIAASYEAKAFGIKTGTPVYEAREKCPGLMCVLADHRKYVEFHQRILEELDFHLPVTAVCSIDEMACYLMDNENSVERATTIAQSIKKGLAKNVGAYIKCSIGISTNRYLAKIATDFMKPDGLTIFQKEDLEDYLLKLKLSDLPGIGRRMEKRLQIAGITSMKDLLALSAPQLRIVWKNVWGEKMWYLLRGWELEQEPTQRSTIGHSHVLAPQFRAPDQAYTIAKRLLLKALSRLRRLGYGAKQLCLGLRFENGEKIVEEIRCALFEDSFSGLKILKQLWDQALKNTKQKRIKKISVSLFSLEEKSANSQLSFFEDTTLYTQQKKHEKLSKVMDAINQKYGKDSILLGMTPKQGKQFTGTKVAFTRIPEVKEFEE